MNLARFVSVQVALVFLVICILPEVVHSGSSSSSSSSSSRSKGKSKSGSSSSKTRSGHQYGPLLMRPSKPDPHFEILDEQRAYYNYGGKLREGRSSNLNKKTNEEEVSSSSNFKKKCCKKEKNTIPATSALKEIPSPALSTNSGRFSIESRFSRKSLDDDKYDQDQSPSQSQYSGFSGSQLISGDVGMMSPQMIKPSKGDERVGWKILMGPSVSPAEEEEFSTTRNNDEMMSKRAFTSLTESNMGNHRTITKLMEVGRHHGHSHSGHSHSHGHGHSNSQKKKGKSHSSSSSSSSPNIYELSPEQFTASQPEVRSQSQKSSSSKRGKTTFKSSSLRNMNLSIPKHKYATVTKKSQNKLHSSSSSSGSSSSSKRSGKKVQMSTSSRNSFKASPSIKSGSGSSTNSRYTSNSGSMEEDLNSLRTSPVMTLDTKKLIIEPDANSVEPTVQNTMVSSMSREAYSGEKGLHDLIPLPSESSLLSRYDPVQLPNDDLMMEDEHEHGGGGDDGNDVSSIRGYDDLNHFQTKTALNPSSSEYPTFSVSASMNYDKGSRSRSHNHNHNHNNLRRIQSGGGNNRGIVTSASAEIPVQHKTKLKSRYQHIRHHVDIVPNYPDPPINFQDEMNAMNNISPEVVDPPPPTRLDNRGFVINTVVQHPTPNNNKPTTQIDFNKLHLPAFPNFGNHIHATGPSNLPHPPPSPEIQSHPTNPEPTPAILPYPGPGPSHSHHVPYILPPHVPPLPPHRGPRFPPPPPRFHHHHRPPLPLPLPPMHHPHHALDGGSGRKIPGEFGVEIGLVPKYSPPPPIGVDPAHPVVQHALRNPQSILNDGVYIEPTDSSSIQETTKKYFQNLHFNVHKNTLVPLDKRLVYLSMIFSWMFWITAFYTYYRYYAHGNHGQQVVLTVPQNGEKLQVSTRALDTSSPWINFTTVLEYIEIAQKTYEGFDWQDLNCQKRTLCELVQKQNEPWGETGRKLANGYAFRVMDALEGIPVPQVIQQYLRQYKEAISQGKNSNKDCGQIYSQCKFSIKDVLNKAAQKKKA